MRSSNKNQADICLILEGTYPYVMGGVSQWTHDLILNLPDLSFHLLSIVPRLNGMDLQYELPHNVLEISSIELQGLPAGKSRLPHQEKLFERLRDPLLKLHSEGQLENLERVLDILAPHKDKLGKRILLESPEAWEFMVDMYQSHFSGKSFLDFFWSWRGLYESLFAALLTELPKAHTYHAISTGYAGLVAARAAIETGQPALLTEHGIYTNERRIEIAMSDWVREEPIARLTIQKENPDMKDFWSNTFANYSKICYSACTKVITLYKGNQKFQESDGAAPEKFEIIPNGIDYQNYSEIPVEETTGPTIALIGRVVPIKDIKTFIRAAGVLKKSFPDLTAYVIGPTDADVPYYEECLNLVTHLGLENTVSFTGRVDTRDYLGRIQVNVLTSISEAQPLVILEAGALGIPTVATDAGSCVELILGHNPESSSLGPAGEITPLSNPSATACAIARLLNDEKWYALCGNASKERVRRFYNKTELIHRYRELYQNYSTADKIPVEV